MNAFKLGRLVTFIKMVEDVPEDIMAICDELEQELSTEPEPRKKGNVHQWSDEQRAAAAERLRQRQAAKKQKQEEFNVEA